MAKRNIKTIRHIAVILAYTVQSSLQRFSRLLRTTALKELTQKTAQWSGPQSILRNGLVSLRIDRVASNIYYARINVHDENIAYSCLSWWKKLCSANGKNKLGLCVPVSASWGQLVWVKLVSLFLLRLAHQQLYLGKTLLNKTYHPSVMASLLYIT